MLSVLTITLPVFLIIGLGYGCARRHVFPTAMQKSLSLFSLYCGMPAYLFLAMAHVPKDLLLNTDYIAAFAVSMACIAGVAGLVARFYHQRGPQAILAMMGACYTNSALVGVPIIVAAFGNPAPVIVIALFQVIVVTTTILTSIDIYQKHGHVSMKVLKTIPRTMLVNPIVSTALLGTLFAWQEWTIPPVVEKACRLLGDAGIPTGLFALGLSLAAGGEPITRATGRLVWWITLLKTVGHPAIAWVMGSLVFGLSHEWLVALVLVSAMPTAVNNFLFSQRYNVFVRESGSVVFRTSVISLFTLTLLLWWFGMTPH